MMHTLSPSPSASAGRRVRVSDAWITFILSALAFVVLSTVSALGQIPGTSYNSSDRSEQQAPATMPIQPPSMQALSGSGIVDKPVPGTVQISILDAIDRGLKHNLALLLSQEQTESARAERRRSLSYLLPNLNGTVNESVNQINLAAFGIPVPASLSSPIIGPFGLFDVRANMNETLLDFSARNRVRSATENEKVARFNVQDARELVVLAVGNEYLIALANAARLETAKAQLSTDQTIYRQTVDMKTAVSRRELTCFAPRCRCKPSNNACSPARTSMSARRWCWPGSLDCRYRRPLS